MPGHVYARMIRREGEDQATETNLPQMQVVVCAIDEVPVEFEGDLPPGVVSISTWSGPSKIGSEGDSIDFRMIPREER